MRIWGVTCHSIFAMVIAFFLIIGVAASPALADHDRSIAKLTAEWWQWAWLNGFPNEGAFATGDIDCSAGQKGKFWFLAGLGDENFDPSIPLGGGEADRRCIDPIPADTQLFFPLVNIAFWNPDDLCNDPNDPHDDFNCTVREKREILRDFLSDTETGARACYLTAAVDGKPVIYKGTSIQRTQSAPFRGTGEAAGDNKVISDGYWVLLPKLKAGKRIIDFTGAFCTFDGFDIIFGNKVTYELRIDD